MRLFFSAQGRIPRHMWWVGLVCLAAANVIAGLILWDVFDVRLYLFNDGRFALFFVSIPLLYMAYCVAAKRFQDRGRSPNNARVMVGISLLKAVLDLAGVTGNPWQPNGLDHVFLFVQIGCGLWFIVELGFMRGTRGRNRYGEDPLQGRAAPGTTARHGDVRGTA